MAVTLSRKAFDHANELIVGGQFVFDGRDAWSEHRPSAQEENELLRRYGFAYGKWYFGINHEPEDTKAHYEFSYGDFKNVHAAAGLLQKVGRANTSTMTSRMQQLTCME